MYNPCCPCHEFIHILYFSIHLICFENLSDDTLNNISTAPELADLPKLTSNLFLNHLTVSSRLILWLVPTRLFARLRLATRSPGRVLQLCQPLILCFQLLIYSHAGEEIHPVNSDRRVILDTKIDVFADTETEVTSLREVALAEFVFLDLQSTLQDFLSLWSTDSDMHSNLLVTTDTESSDSVSGLAYKYSLNCATSNSR
jgi:hypothetical protein